MFIILSREISSPRYLIKIYISRLILILLRIILIMLIIVILYIYTETKPINNLFYFSHCLILSLLLTNFIFFDITLFKNSAEIKIKQSFITHSLMKIFKTRT